MFLSSNLHALLSCFALNPKENKMKGYKAFSRLRLDATDKQLWLRHLLQAHRLSHCALSFSRPLEGNANLKQFEICNFCLAFLDYFSKLWHFFFRTEVKNPHSTMYRMIHLMRFSWFSFTRMEIWKEKKREKLHWNLISI